jgi:hypothetical protein
MGTQLLQYEKLTRKTNIRILTGFGSHEGQISCTLSTADLTELQEAYCALSYTWDNPIVNDPAYVPSVEPEAFIVCNGLKKTVQKKLVPGPATAS